MVTQRNPTLRRTHSPSWGHFNDCVQGFCKFGRKVQHRSCWFLFQLKHILNCDPRIYTSIKKKNTKSTLVWAFQCLKPSAVFELWLKISGENISLRKVLSWEQSSHTYNLKINDEPVIFSGTVPLFALQTHLKTDQTISPLFLILDVIWIPIYTIHLMKWPIKTCFF